MGLTFDATQVGRLLYALNQTGERAVRGALEEMKEEAREIVALAKDYAPYDIHPNDPAHLENAITWDVVKGGRDEKGRFQRDSIEIYVDEEAPGSGGAETVGQYAARMHEGLAPYGTGFYQPGPGTIAKGPQAGGKFLERAILDRAVPLFKRLKSRIARVFK